jgi:MFS transporter, UMF1 family
MAARRRDVVSWTFYDFGSSAFNTLIVTFIFSRFFTDVMAADTNTGTVLWARAINISAVVVALITPVLGAVADYSGRKKAFLVFFAGLCIVFTGTLFFVPPGQAALAMVLFIIANIGFECANVFYSAFLPEVSEERNIGRISGYGFALGYIGGLIALVIGLWMVKGGLPKTDYLNVRGTIMLVSVWFLIFSLPMFLFVRQQQQAQRLEGGYIKQGFQRLYHTIQHARRFKEAGKLLIARMIYNDGLGTVIAMASIYAGAVLGMPLDAVLKMGISLNVFAGIGAFGFGYVDDRIGGKKTILITLVLLIIGTSIGVATTTVTGFWVAAAIIGIMMGPNQAASRSLLSKLAPDDKQAEFFGLYSFSGRLSSMLGPLAYGTIVASTGNHKLAMSSIIAFFVVGGLILLTVHEAEGMRLAGREPV